MPDASTHTGGRAVFLSYAREDTNAARRIAEALRGFGIEVWFDQAELRGGDQWDARIRGQIKTCALFIPLISATTQARDEAYFRLEWKLADDRSQLMAPGKPFIVPVVIDATPESGAVVPESFARAQWTRLDDGDPSTAFIEQVKRLLESPKKPALMPGQPRPPTLPPEFREAARKAGNREQGTGDGRVGAKSGVPGWIWVAVALVVVAIAAGFFLASKSDSATASVQPASPDPKSSAPNPSRSPQADAKSIAVLPFANMSAEMGNEFLADGIHEDVLTSLAKIRDLKVISRTSVLAYRDTASRNLKKIAAELGVAVVLEGSVRRSGNQVRVTAQLIDARTDEHIWAETYDGDTSDVFGLQSRLAQQIATALKANLTAGERTLIARRPTENARAYDLYLRARILDQALQVYSPRSEYERVNALYEEAAALDPAFTLAHVQASISHGTMFWFANLDPSPARKDRTRAALEKARALAPGSPEVRLAEGSFAYTCNNDWRGALAEYRAAEAGLPNDAQLQYRMALAHRRLGELREALTRLERCVALNPNDSRAVTTLVETVMALRRYPQVGELVERYRGLLSDDHLIIRLQLLARQELDGDWQAFVTAMATVRPRSSDPHGLDAGYVLALNKGDLGAAERILEDPRWQTVLGLGGIVNEPPALHRAQLAWLRGRPDEARRHADEAIRIYRTGTWNARQQPVAQMGIARAEAFAGRYDVAIREARAALAAQEAMDQFNYAFIRHWLGTVLVVAGRPEEALAELRRLMAGLGTMSPGEFRHDPIWSRLKDDPRFEEILKSAKPL
jgi:TolB-like protein/tetratricopeptide (TPR) repeat protein